MSDIIMKMNYNLKPFGLNNLAYKIHQHNSEPGSPHPDPHTHTHTHTQSHQLPFNDSLPPASAGLFCLFFDPEDGGDIFFRNYTRLQTRRPYYSNLRRYW
jgi:hypothetical protein